MGLKNVFKKTARVGGQATAKKIAKSNTYTGSIMRGVKKSKKLAKNVRRAGKFISFCISNPVGWIVGIATIAILCSCISSITESVNKPQGNERTVDMNGEKVTLLLIDCLKEKSKTPGMSSSASNQKDAWLTEGTESFNVAKAIFDTWTNEGGLSGEAAAGLLGWIAHEGGFDVPGRAQGHFGNDPATTSISYGVEPIGGGGGIYQFTPYTKYAPLGDSKWDDAAEQTRFVMGSLPNDWNPSYDLTHGGHSFKDFASATNETEACLMWNAFERGLEGAEHADVKQASAVDANKVFNTAQIQFDEKKFHDKFGGGKPQEEHDSLIREKRGKNGKKATRCKESFSSGGSAWQAKGGVNNFADGTAWKYGELPDELKKYAINPESVGMKFQSTDGWNVKAYDWGNCTDLSASLMYMLWTRGGEHPRQAMGDGITVASHWAEAFGGSTTHEPTAGAVFSCAAGTSAGHTGVVSHVFEDNSILIIEQNLIGYSGVTTGMYNSWNYRIVGADKVSAWEYYNPGANGWSPNTDVHSL